MMMLTKQSKVHNETIWKSPYLRKFLSLDLANWLINMETGESCCLKWSFSLTLCEIPSRFSSILPNVKISLTLRKIPWQFPDLEKFYFSLTFSWRLWTLMFWMRIPGKYGWLSARLQYLQCVAMEILQSCTKPSIWYIRYRSQCIDTHIVSIKLTDIRSPSWQFWY